MTTATPTTTDRQQELRARIADRNEAYRGAALAATTDPTLRKQVAAIRAELRDLEAELEDLRAGEEERTRRLRQAQAERAFAESRAARAHTYHNFRRIAERQAAHADRLNELMAGLRGWIDEAVLLDEAWRRPVADCAPREHPDSRSVLETPDVLRREAVYLASVLRPIKADTFATLPHAVRTRAQQIEVRLRKALAIDPQTGEAL